MAQNTNRLSEALVKEILSFSRHIAGSCRITAACVCGDYALGLPAARTAVQVLAVIHDFQPRLMNYAKAFDSSSLSVLAVDEWVFDRDVDRGFLGEALAGGLIFSYVPLVNEEYLHQQEIQLKKRLVIELLESLVLDFPELSYGFYIKPDYFMYETLLTRARLFPPMMYTLSSFMGKKKEQRENEVLTGFLEALRELEKEGVIGFTKGYVTISKQFVDKARKRKVIFTNLFKTGQRALFASLLGIFPQILTVLSQNREFFLNFQRVLEETAKGPSKIEDPENYIYVPTVTGLAPLGNRTDIEAFARKVLHADNDSEVKVENIGGILNDVYAVMASRKKKEMKVVVKRYRDWSNFKWFPLTLWTVGTRTFAVLGRSRLERECAINQLLDSNGLAVPRVLYVSPSERLIFMEYVEGEDLSKVIKRVANSKHVDARDLELVGRTGELFARVHTLGVALGDTKPENVLIGRDDRIYLTDFEQASRNGDRVWDIAEFLYYSGHDISPFAKTAQVEQFAKTFVRGYLKAGGSVKAVKDAGNPKYTKVFSVFTFPSIMLILSNICRTAEKLREDNGKK